MSVYVYNVLWKQFYFPSDETEELFFNNQNIQQLFFRNDVETDKRHKVVTKRLRPQRYFESVG